MKILGFILTAIVISIAANARADVANYCTNSTYRDYNKIKNRLNELAITTSSSFATLIKSTATTPENGETINYIEITSTATGTGVVPKESRPRIIVHASS